MDVLSTRMHKTLRTVPNKEETMDVLSTRMHETAMRIGLPLDSQFSYVQSLEDGTTCLTASVMRFATSNEERSMSQSALHAALLEDFADLAAVEVRVFLPPIANAPPLYPPANDKKVLVLASQRIRECSESMQDYAQKMVCQFANHLYNVIINTYPWLERDAMRARIPDAIQRSVMHLKKGTTDPLLTQYRFDLVLPSLESVIRADEKQAVFNDVARVLMGDPESMLDVYEGIYLCGTHRALSAPVSLSTYTVFARVFSQ
jgi:hypothetical protein